MRDKYHMQDLIGEFRIEELLAKGFPWMHSATAPRAAANASRNIEILAFVGTWCPDCQEQVPNLLKWMDERHFSPDRARFIGLSRDKVLAPWTERYRIRRVPTFVLLRDGVEIGRVIEGAPAGLTHQLGESLQERYAAKSICFGCGPANAKGLRIRSFAEGAESASTVADWFPESFHEAFPGMLNGGIIGSLLDCHCNWTAANQLMRNSGADHPPCTVTAEYSIKLLRPTPTDSVIHLSAKAIETRPDRAVIEGTLTAGGKVCATCRGTFVAVKEGHPAYHRW